MEDQIENAFSEYLRQSQYLQHQLRYVLPDVIHSQDFDLPENLSEDLESLTLAAMSLTQLIKFYKKDRKGKNPAQVDRVQNEDKKEYEGMIRTLSNYFDSTGVILFGHYCCLCRFSSFDVNEWQSHILSTYHVNVLHFLRTSSTALYEFNMCTVCLLVFFGELGHVDSILSSKSHSSYHFKMESLLLQSSAPQAAFPQVPREWMHPAVPQMPKKFKPLCNRAKSPEQNSKEEELKMKNSVKYSTVVMGLKTQKTNPGTSKDQQKSQPETTSNRRQYVPQFRPENKMNHHQKSQKDEYGWQLVSNKKYTKRIAPITRMNKIKNPYPRSYQSLKEATVNAESMSKNVPKPKTNFAPKRKPPHDQGDMVQKSSFAENQQIKKILRPVENAVPLFNRRQPIKVREDEKCTKLLLSEENVLTSKENEAPDAGKLLASETIVSEGEEETTVAGKPLTSEGCVSANEDKAPVTEKLPTSETIVSEGEEETTAAGKLLTSEGCVSANEDEAPVTEKLPTSETIVSEGEEETGVAGKLRTSEGCVSAGEDEAPVAGKLPASKDIESTGEDVKKEQDKDQKKLAKESRNTLIMKTTEVDNSKHHHLKSDVDNIDIQETNVEENKEGKKKRRNRRGRNKKNRIINEGKVINQDVQEDNETQDIVQSVGDDAALTLKIELSQYGLNQLIFEYQTSDELDAEDLLRKLKKRKIASNFSFIGLCIHCYEMFDRGEWLKHLQSHEYVETKWCKKCDTIFCGDEATIKELLNHTLHSSIDRIRNVFIIYERPEKNGKFEFVGYCLECDFDYNISEWDEHVESHGNSQERINCDECNMSFYGDKTEIENLIKSRHHFSIHTIATNVEDLILKIFDIKKNKFDPDSNPEFIGLCVACAKIFESSFDWCEHLDVHKEDEYEELLCEECNTNFFGLKETMEKLCINIHSLYS